jgi:hypothetical protein
MVALDGIRLDRRIDLAVTIVSDSLSESAE